MKKHIIILVVFISTILLVISYRHMIQRDKVTVTTKISIEKSDINQIFISPYIITDDEIIDQIVLWLNQSQVLGKPGEDWKMPNLTKRKYGLFRGMGIVLNDDTKIALESVFLLEFGLINYTNITGLYRMNVIKNYSLMYFLEELSFIASQLEDPLPLEELKELPQTISQELKKIISLINQEMYHKLETYRMYYE